MGDRRQAATARVRTGIRPLRGWLLLTAGLVLAACAARPPSPAMPSAIDSVGGSNNNLNATLWMQHAQEFRAAVRGSFAVAERQLERALADPDWDALPAGERSGPARQLPPAVIVDADETMIDNSAFQARNIRDHASYSVPRWEAWANERRARLMPGALEFARRAEALGVTVFYVTNRGHAGEFDATAENLHALGFPLRDDRSNLFLMGDPRAPEHDKGSRRRWIGERHRVLLMLGDNLGDFLDGSRADMAARDRLMAPYQGWWGERWIMLPNPAYGSWEGGLMRGCADQTDVDACLRSALRYD